MRTQYSYVKILLFLSSIYFFCPDYLSNPFIQLIANVTLILNLTYLFYRKYKPSKLAMMFLLYQVYVIGISFINGTDMANIHLVVSAMKLLAVVALLDFAYTNNYKSVLKCMTVVLMIYVFWDAITVILYPDGLYKSEVIWNEWTTTYDTQWLYGNKNNRIMYYLLLLFLIENIREFTNSLAITVIEFVTAVISCAVAVLTDANTSLIVLITALCGIYSNHCKNDQLLMRINAKLATVLYCIIEVLIILGVATFLGPLVEGLFGKNLTFSNRTFAWQAAALLIVQKPLFGWGVLGNEETSALLGNLAYVNTHNQIIDTLLEGGVVLLFILIFIFIINIKRINNRMRVGENNYLVLYLLAILVEATFEVLFSAKIVWILLILIYNRTRMSMNSNIME